MRTAILSLAAVVTTLSVPSIMAASPQSQSIPFLLQDNLVRLPAVVNGRQVVAVLDSGAGAVLVDKPVTDRLNVTAGAAAGVGAGGGTGAQDLFAVKIALLRVGSMELSDIAGYAIDLGHLTTSAGFPVEALLGYPLFEKSVVKIDYPHRTVAFDRSGVAAACAHPVPLEIVNNTPVATVMMKPSEDASPVKLRMVVDLGSRHFAAMIGGPFLRSDVGKALWTRGTPRQVGTGVGGVVNGSATSVAELRIGGQVFRQQQIALTPEVRAFDMGFIDGSLGVPLWNNRTITFDYAHRRLCLSDPVDG